jgi:hypothetical protein
VCAGTPVHYEQTVRAPPRAAAAPSSSVEHWAMRSHASAGICGRAPPPPPPLTSVRTAKRSLSLAASGQGLTNVHFSAQPEPFLTRNTPEIPRNDPWHLLDTSKTTPKHPLSHRKRSL